MEKTEHPIIEIDISLEYRDKEVYIKRINTNSMPAMLYYDIMSALTKTIEDYYSEGGINIEKYEGKKVSSPADGPQSGSSAD